MTKSNFSDHECPIALALDQVGDWWSLLIIRDAMYGTSQFDEFRKGLGISRAILSERLKKLAAVGVLEKQANKDDGRSVDYSLTSKGRALWPVIVSLMLWGNQWIAEDGREPVEARSIKTGEPVAQMSPVDADGRTIRMRDIRLIEGPGASAEYAAQIRKIYE